MSEHDEPKTALTTTRPDPSDLPEGTPVLAWPGSRDSSPLLTRTRTPVFQTRSGDLLVSVDGHPGGIALTHIEVMPEGYTTSPAPEATETVEWEYGVAWWWIGGDGHHASATVPSDSEAAAHERVAGMFNAHVVRRPKPDEWVPVDRAADEHEEGGPPESVGPGT